MDTGFGSRKPWSPAYSPTAIFILSKEKAPTEIEASIVYALDCVWRISPFQGPRARRPEATVSEIQVLLATQEHPTVASTPDTARAAVARAEPLPIVAVPDVEHAEVAIRVCDWLHPDEHPLILGLVRILQTQLWTNFGRAGVETVLVSPLVDFGTSATVGQTEVLRSDQDQFDFSLGVTRLEGGLAEDVVSPVAHAVATVLEGLLEARTILDAGAQLDGLPDLHVGRHLGEPEMETALDVQEMLVERPVPGGIAWLRALEKPEGLVEPVTQVVEASRLLEVLRGQRRNDDVDVIPKQLPHLSCTTDLLDQSIELSASQVSHRKPFTSRSHGNLLGLIRPVSVCLLSEAGAMTKVVTARKPRF